MLLRWQAPQPWRSRPSRPWPERLDPYVIPYVNLYVIPYALGVRTPGFAGQAHQCWSVPLRGASQPQKPRLTGPPRGSGASARQGALRAIDSFRRSRSWRTCGPRRLRRQSQPPLTITQGGAARWRPLPRPGRKIASRGWLIGVSAILADLRRLCLTVMAPSLYLRSGDR